MGQSRNRHKEGWVALEKRCNPHRWIAYWYTDQPYVDSRGVVRYKKGSYVLGPRTKDGLPTKSAAERKWREVREQRMAPARNERERDLTFRQFLEREFIPIKRSGWNPETMLKLEYFFNFMLDDFGDDKLASLGKRRLAEFLEKLAQRYCRDTVIGCLTYLRAILAEAVTLKYSPENPAVALKPPAAMKERDATILTLEEVASLMAALSGRDSVIFHLMASCGPRAGEAFGFQWIDLRDDQTLMIARTYSRYKLKKPKTEEARNTIYLPASLFQDLQKLKEQSNDPSPAGWIFPSSRKRRGFLAPLDYHNWINRVLKPVAGKLGIRVNAQILRRSFASLANQGTQDLKAIQRQLRHSRAGTTADTYTQPIPESVKQAVETLDQSILGAAK